MNDYKLNRTNKRILTTNEIKSIENRKKLSALMRAKDKIEDYQNEVFNIIDEDGLKNENGKDRLNAAFKTLPFIIPIKKQAEVIITTRKIEDLIQEDIEEAEIIESGEID